MRPSPGRGVIEPWILRKGEWSGAGKANESPQRLRSFSSMLSGRRDLNDCDLRPGAKPHPRGPITLHADPAVHLQPSLPQPELSAPRRPVAERVDSTDD